MQDCPPGGAGAVLPDVHQVLHGPPAAALLHHAALHRSGGEAFLMLVRVVRSSPQGPQEVVLLGCIAVRAVCPCSKMNPFPSDISRLL